MELFMEYSWPGNVRELQNIIEHGLVVSRGDELDVPQAYFGQALEEKRKSELIPLEEYEKQYILEVLQHTKGAIYGPKGAAVILGLKPSTLQSRMKKLCVERPKSR
jgi:formate hydrogenlyase transcriptional activator